MTRATPVVLVASNFPPVRGGSASVYAALARCAGGQVMVLAPQVNYADGLPIIGWREYDRQAPFQVRRIPLLRTIIADSPPRGLRRLLFLAWDAALRVRVAAALLRLRTAIGPLTLCIGELLASSWIIRLFRHVPGIRIVAYVHGEEITTANPGDPGNRTGHQALQRCDAVIVVCRFTLAAVVALLGGPASRDRPGGQIRLIENGVDNSRFTPGEKSAALLERYGLTGAFVFVSV
ncbi:MAG: putative glycosyltransferase, partial [Belnapia sp.]|nr:putative glycosyltransferase [Belnapia sp.]